MLKYLHPEFPSDMFTILESIGTKIEIASINDVNGSTLIPICNLLDTNVSMKGKILTSLILPKLSGQEYRYHSYKVNNNEINLLQKPPNLILLCRFPNDIKMRMRM